MKRLSILETISATVEISRPSIKFISKNFVKVRCWCWLVSNIRTVTGIIFNTPVSLLPSSIKLNGKVFKSAIISDRNWLPTQLTTAAVLVRPHDKFSAARVPLNSLLMHGATWWDKLRWTKKSYHCGRQV